MDTDSTVEEWRQRVAGILGDIAVDPAKLQFLSHRGTSSGEDAAFVSRVLELTNNLPDTPCRSNEAIEFVARRVPIENWPTPIFEKNGPMLTAGAVVMNGVSLLPFPFSLMIAFNGLPTAFFFFRGLRRAWSDARFRAGYRALLGGRNPLWRPRVVAGLAVTGFLFAVALPVARALPGLFQARTAGNTAGRMAERLTSSTPIARVRRGTAS